MQSRTVGMRPIGTAEELERRRRRAIQLVNEGEHPADVARFLGCGRSSVYTWLKWQREAPAELAAKPHPGRPSGLSDDQLVRLEELLLEGPKAHGWRTELWTADRVKEMVGRHFGVDYHPEHVRKIVKRKLGWTSQKPQKKARERDEIAIDH
jgi:transposase